MPALVYRICALLSSLLQDVPLGTNLGLVHLFLALLSGRFLAARGAVFAALDSLGLAPAAVRRAAAALCYGRWQSADLLARWQRCVLQEGAWVRTTYEGICPVPCDLTAFFRPQLRALVNKHYVSQAGKALPALVFGLAVGVGRVGSTRLALPRLMLRRHDGQSEAAFARSLLAQAAATLSPQEALIVDAGFALQDLLALSDTGFVARVRTNQTARRRTPAPYRGKGRPPQKGQIVRPLSRTRSGNVIEATPPDATACWKDGSYRLTAVLWSELTLPHPTPAAVTFRLVAISDPRYKQPLLLATNLSVSAEALWRLYRDRWAVEQVPLAAKPLLGTERAFVFGQESRYRLPEIALLAGNLLSYVAAASAPCAAGFWDRAARPSGGRLRRRLSRLSFAEFSFLGGQLRKKQSVTAHLRTGVEAHRRQKADPKLDARWINHQFTGN